MTPAVRQGFIGAATAALGPTLIGAAAAAQRHPGWSTCGRVGEDKDEPGTHGRNFPRLYAVLAREYFGQRIMGTVFGAATMVSSMGMAFGPLIGGWIYDAFNAYAWLFIGSAAVGLGAMFVALVLPPLPPLQRARLQPA